MDKSCANQGKGTMSDYLISIKRPATTFSDTNIFNLEMILTKIKKHCFAILAVFLNRI